MACMSVVANRPILTRTTRRGASLYLLLPTVIAEALAWHAEDNFALRIAGNKLIVDRIAVDKLAIIRTGETVER